MVTGGFHTEGISKLLKQKNVPYFVITPNVTKDTKSSDLIYDELVKHQAKILAQSFALWMLSNETPGIFLKRSLKPKCSRSSTLLARKPLPGKGFKNFSKTRFRLEQELVKTCKAFSETTIGNVEFVSCVPRENNNYLLTFKTSNKDGSNEKALSISFQLRERYCF